MPHGLERLRSCTHPLQLPDSAAGASGNKPSNGTHRGAQPRTTQLLARAAAPLAIYLLLPHPESSEPAARHLPHSPSQWPCAAGALKIGSDFKRYWNQWRYIYYIWADKPHIRCAFFSLAAQPHVGVRDSAAGIQSSSDSRHIAR